MSSSAPLSSSAKLPPLYLPPAIFAEAARLRKQPGFQDAVRLNAEELLSFYERQPLLNHLVSEEARWLTGGFILFLHFTRRPDDPTSGATLARVQAMAVDHGLASPGRIAALVGLMRLGGFVKQVSVSGDRRMRRLEPTESLLGYSRRWLAAHLGPLALASPADDHRALHEKDPTFLERYYREAGRLYFGGGRIPELIPAIRLFMGRDAAYMILLRLWISDPSGAVPPRQPVALPYGEIGKRFGVSRAHVRKIMEAAQAEGYLELLAEGGQAIRVMPPLIDLFEDCFALQLAYLAHCARVAARG